MTFSVDPGIYIPGRFGIGTENIVHIAGGRPRRFDEYPRTLQVV